MSKSYDALAEYLKALADSSRIAILDVLKDGEKTPKEIQDALGKSQSTVSQQLKILSSKNIILSRKDGTNRYYSVKQPEIHSILKSISNLLIQKQMETMEGMHDNKDILL
jgi:DNA-binding transcriptional ArsR family regulator